MKTQSLTPSRKSARGYTLLELLIVISIIAILASLSFPVTGKVIEMARKAECNQQISNLTTAIKGYQMEYGHVPLKSGGGGADLSTDTKDQPLMECLMGIPLATPATDYKNAREISFYEPKYVKQDKGGWNDTTKGLFDPWGNEYKIALDTDFNKFIDVTTVFPDVTLEAADHPAAPGARTDVAIMSAGPDGEWGTKDDLFSWTK